MKLNSPIVFSLLTLALMPSQAHGQSVSSSRHRASFQAQVIAFEQQGNAAAASPMTSLQANDPIESIRQHYANINQNVSSYRRVKKELWGFSPEGGEMVAYFHGPTLMKIVATFLGETGRAVEEYYFWDSKVMFVLSTDNRYDQPFGKVVRKNETRLYFKEDKLIRWLGEDGKEMAPGSAEYATKQTDYLKLSKLLSDGAKSKARKIESPD